MAAQFAGSRSLDERRRRRIAGTWDEDATVASPPPADSHPDGPASSGSYTPRSRRRLPLQRVIPALLWKHVLAATFLLTVGVAIFALESEAERIAESLGPAAGEFVSARNGRLLPFFSGVLLAASAQLSLLIGWVRSRSRTDFSGRFRIWRWAAAAGFLLAATVMLELHLLWSHTLIWRLRLDFAHAETLCWLAPAIGCGSVLVRDLLADIRSCRGSSLFLWLAVLSWGASVFLLLSGSGLLADTALHALAVRAAAAFGHYCLFVGLLLQARFVLFVSAEPPEQRRSRILRALTATTAYMLKPVRGASRWRRRKRTRRGEPDTADRDAGTLAVADAFQDSRRLTRDAAGKRTLRIDEPHELSELSGNDRKESRRSLKHKRDKSRASS
jgi:hypothetical protein